MYVCMYIYIYTGMSRYGLTKTSSPLGERPGLQASLSRITADRLKCFVSCSWPRDATW